MLMFGGVFMSNTLNTQDVLSYCIDIVARYHDNTLTPENCKNYIEVEKIISGVEKDHPNFSIDQKRTQQVIGIHEFFGRDSKDSKTKTEEIR